MFKVKILSILLIASISMHSVTSTGSFLGLESVFNGIIPELLGDNWFMDDIVPILPMPLDIDIPKAIEFLDGFGNGTKLNPSFKNFHNCLTLTSTDILDKLVSALSSGIIALPSCGNRNCYITTIIELMTNVQGFFNDYDLIKSGCANTPKEFKDTFNYITKFITQNDYPSKIIAFVKKNIIRITINVLTFVEDLKTVKEADKFEFIGNFVGTTVRQVLFFDL
jgi:hypothetical protein